MHVCMYMCVHTSSWYKKYLTLGAAVKEIRKQILQSTVIILGTKLVENVNIFYIFNLFQVDSIMLFS